MIPLWLAWLAHGAEPEGDEVVEVTVHAEAQQRSASTRTLDRVAVEATPGRSADSLLRAMPGLHQSAHGGTGKAYQYFLRGFDAVHGADLAISVGEVPINEPSNVHAHGYLDLHFLPTVLVRSMTLSPGTWRSDRGDFAIAGSAGFEVGLEQGGGLLAVAGGTDRSGRATFAWRPETSAPGTFLVAEVDAGLGVGESRRWRQVRGGGGIEGRVGTMDLRAWVLAYDGAFDSPGVLREDDWESGAVGFYDAYPGSGGGRSSRVLGAVQATGTGAEHAWRVTGWGGWRNFALQQNFTGWYSDAVHGDGTTQHHEAWSGGARGWGTWSPTGAVALTGGVEGRFDQFVQRTDRVEVDGTVWGAGDLFQAWQSEVGGWIAAPLHPVPWLRVEPGLRASVFLVTPKGEGLAWAPALAPKFAVTANEDGVVTGFAAYGRGFRSPDARGVTGGGRAPVALADSAEVGVRVRPSDRLELRTIAFGTLVSDEIVFDHVAARYLATGSTRRWGVEGGVTWRPLEAVRLEADITGSDGRYRTTGDPIPYAPRFLASVKALLERREVGKALLTGGLRTWVLAPRPLPGGFYSHTAVVVDLTGRVGLGPWLFTLDVDNLLATKWRDGEFQYASWWDTTQPRSGLSARHFTAGTPFAVRLGMGWRF